MKNIVRLASLELSNIKNVRNGRIVMPNMHRKHLSYNNAEVLGLYGQNGSGKTAAIDALYFLQRIMLGDTLDERIVDYIDKASDTAEIKAEFNVFIDDVTYEVQYLVCFERKENNVAIVREYLGYYKNADGHRDKKAIALDFVRSNADASASLRPQKRVRDIIEVREAHKTDLIVAIKMAEKSKCSYIFGESGREIFVQDYSNDFGDGSLIVKALFWFAVRDLFVIRNSNAGAISAKLVLPMSFRIDDDDTGVKGEFAIPLHEPIVLAEERMEILEKIINQINIVLINIIPGLKIEIFEHGAQIKDNGEKGWKIELMSAREGKLPIPIRMESDGIIKIISILNALIQAFGNPSICLAVDELDSGVFEYMLGEILDIFNKRAKGQLVFTSHNLRALEMLGKDCIMFSTANPDNRYIRMKNIKATNNLRDMYLRGLTLGGQEEIIYEETDSLKIARAFRRAGDSSINEFEKGCSSNC